MRSSPCRNYSLLGISHPIVGPPFRYKECTERRGSDEAVIMKEADVWPWYYFCKNYFVIKLFWDYCLKSRVCNYGKRAVIRLLRAELSVLLLYFRFKCE